MGADLHARHARDEAKKAAREADRAEACAWSVRMEDYGGPAQPSPTIGQCIHDGLGWLEVECNRCKTRASMPLDAIRRQFVDGVSQDRLWRSLMKRNRPPTETALVSKNTNAS